MATCPSSFPIILIIYTQSQKVFFHVNKTNIFCTVLCNEVYLNTITIIQYSHTICMLKELLGIVSIPPQLLTTNLVLSPIRTGFYFGMIYLVYLVYYLTWSVILIQLGECMWVFTPLIITAGINYPFLTNSLVLL